MTEIEVDFNNRGANGTVRGSLNRAGNVLLGDPVVLVDSAEGLRFDALVASIDAANGRVFYSVSWERPGLLDLLEDATANAFQAKSVSNTVGARPKVKIGSSSVPKAFGPFSVPVAV